MPSFGDWEATVLGHCYDHVDYISLHSYYTEREHDRASFLACATGMDSFIEAVIATADHVRAKGRHAKRINLSFDEWNVWHTLGQQAEGDWERAPRLIEDDLRPDRRGRGRQPADQPAPARRPGTHGVPGPAGERDRGDPVRAGGPSWRQTIFHPFALTSRHGRGTVLQTPVAAPDYDTPAFGAVPKADAVAVLSDSGDELTVFAVNRDQRAPLPVAIDVRSLPALRVAHHTYIGDDEPSAANTQDAPDRIVPRAGADFSRRRRRAGNGPAAAVLEHAADLRRRPMRTAWHSGGSVASLRHCPNRRRRKHAKRTIDRPCAGKRYV